MPLQIRRGTDAERLLLAVPLANGELLWTTDSKKLFVGDGTTVARDLTAVINYNDTDAQQAAGTLIANATTTDISLSYNSTTNSLTAAVNLSAFRQNVDMGGFTLNGQGNIDIIGDISATGRLIGNYNGSLFGDDSTLLVDGTNSVIVGPINSANITGIFTGSVVGNLTGNTVGYHTGDVKGSVVGDDSTILVDGVSSRIVGKINTDEAFFDSRGLAIESTMTVVHEPADIGVLIESSATDDRGPKLSFSSYRGTRESKSVVNQDDILGLTAFSGYSETPFGFTDADLCGIRSVLTVEGDSVTLPEAKIEFLCFKGPNPANAKIATFDPNGIFTAPVIRPGVYADATARDTDITAPGEGMMIFNIALQKFQGYVSDTGLAGGGSSNSTPGWIDLN